MALHRQLTRRGGEYDAYDPRKNSRVEDLLEEIDELRGQLACEENSRETCEEMLRCAEDTALSHENALKGAQMGLQELAVYKAKCLFLQRQSGGARPARRRPRVLPARCRRLHDGR